MFAAVSYFRPSLIFASKDGAYPRAVLYDLPCLEILRVGWNWLTVTNNLAYYCTGLFYSHKKLYIAESLVNKNFFRCLKKLS